MGKACIASVTSAYDFQILRATYLNMAAGVAPGSPESLRLATDLVRTFTGERDPDPVMVGMICRK